MRMRKKETTALSGRGFAFSGIRIFWFHDVLKFRRCSVSGRASAAHAGVKRPDDLKIVADLLFGHVSIPLRASAAKPVRMRCESEGGRWSCVQKPNSISLTADRHRPDMVGGIHACQPRFTVLD
jgi:hypothetical protein